MEAAALILTTFERRDDAVRTVRTLVEERHAACGNILPQVVSIYRWKDRIEQAEEVMVLLKCPAAGVADLQRRLIELHPYEVPEVVVLQPSEVSPDYLRWLGESCKKPPPTG